MGNTFSDLSQLKKFKPAPAQAPQPAPAPPEDRQLADASTSTDYFSSLLGPATPTAKKPQPRRATVVTPSTVARVRAEQAEDAFAAERDSLNTAIEEKESVIEAIALDLAKVKEALDLGRKILPDDPNLMVAEADYYYWIEDDKSGDALLANLPASVYNNPEATVNIANFHIKKKNYTQAEQLLKKALLTYPNNYTICYNLGVCCYYISEENFLKANELEVAGKTKEAYPIKIQAENYLQEAERHFKTALRQAPDDLNILYTLRSIYKRMDSPEYDNIDKQIQTLENK